MAIRSSDQISIIDITDAYSVILTSESHTFPGSTSAALAGSVTTQVIAMCGANRVAAKITVSEITKPSGVTVSSDGDTTSPTLTIAVTTSVTSGGIVKIPVHIGDITITKEFSFAIAYKGSTGAAGTNGTNGTSVTVSNTAVTYAVSANTTQPTSWSGTMPTANPGQYLWTKTVVTYSDGKSTTTYSYALQGATGATGATGAAGANGTSVTVSSTAVTYGSSASASTQPTSWNTTMPTVAAGQYLWTKTVVTYSDGKSTTTYSYAKQGEKGATGATGAAGADAITLSITSSNGTIFKNSSIETVLTAHVYKAGVELTSSQISALGTIKWYKDGGTTAVGTGTNLTIDAGDVTNKASYIAQLEG